MGHAHHAMGKVKCAPSPVAAMTDGAPESACLPTIAAGIDSSITPTTAESAATEDGTKAGEDAVVKRLQAECRMWSDACEAQEKKLESFLLKYDELKHEHAAVVAQHDYIWRMIHSAEASFYDIIQQDVCAHGSGNVDWAACYGKLVAAVRPILTHRASTERP
jgi:hypothetical protein